MRPRHYDRFVLVGLCWLYGRSEFPPPLPRRPSSRTPSILTTRGGRGEGGGGGGETTKLTASIQIAKAHEEDLQNICNAVTTVEAFISCTCLDVGGAGESLRPWLAQAYKDGPVRTSGLFDND